MNRQITKQKAARWMGALALTAASGCINLPTWKVPRPQACQNVEDAWGCAVDYVGHQSPIDQPCHDPQYQPKGFYRVAAYGIPSQSQNAEYQEREESDSSTTRGDLKPSIYGDEDDAVPLVPVPE